MVDGRAVRPCRLLLPIWGRRFVRQFLDLALPSWLAPGNLPALAADGSAKVIFLTTASDRDYLRRQPEWRALTDIVRVGFCLIDDLIVPGNHATIQTLAWERAIRRYGERLTEIEFMLMLSDALLADGTLRAVAQALRDGARGVMLGGLQVVYEDVAKRPAPSLAPRALVQWGLQHLHPSLAASFVNQAADGAAISHSAHPNHFFWRIDDATVIARYFLIYMIGVRPETAAFEISASNDLGFPSEFCPSGNIRVIDDSDQGLFVECAPRSHEAVLLASGPHAFDDLVASLAGWTTAQHRRFSDTRVIFHGGEKPDPAHPVLHDSDAFIARLTAALPAQTQPHRNHPYWAAAFNAFVLERSRTASSSTTQGRGLARRLLWALLGQPPTVRIWHPLWHDFRLPLAHCRREWVGTAKRILILQDTPHPLGDWLARQHPAVSSHRVDAVVGGDALADSDGALVVVTPERLSELGAIMTALTPRLPGGASVLLHVVGAGGVQPLERLLVGHAGALMRPGFVVEHCEYAGSRIQHHAHRLYATAARLFVRSGRWRTAAAAGLIALAAGLALIDNLLRLRRSGAPRRCSSATVLLRRR